MEVVAQVLPAAWRGPLPPAQVIWVLICAAPGCVSSFHGFSEERPFPAKLVFQDALAHLVKEKLSQQEEPVTRKLSPKAHR